jgi:hypothetical protein
VSKNALTAVNAIAALLITMVGAMWIELSQPGSPIASLLMAGIVVTLPTIIATRIGWSNGYRAALRKAQVDLTTKRL